MNKESHQGKIKTFKSDSYNQITIYFKEHGPLLSSEVTGQDVPKPDDDTMAAVKTSIVDGVFPEKRRGRQKQSIFENPALPLRKV